MSTSPQSSPTPSPSPPRHRSSAANSTTSHQSQSSPPPLYDQNDIVALVPFKPKKHSFPVREDCWSEAASSTLIEAWGDKFLECNRGNLRQNHWRDVAAAVNDVHGETRATRRTDVQCKNRIDTLKKKYKVEKSKILGSHGRYVSSWPHFDPLDCLLGSTFKILQTTPASSRPIRKRMVPVSAVSSYPVIVSALPAAAPQSVVPVGVRSKRPKIESLCFKKDFSPVGMEDSDSDESRSSDGEMDRGEGFRLRPCGGGETGGEKELRMLAEAIGKFGEVYERVEECKQRQVLELEKQRMKFVRDLEMQRMKLFAESQVQIEKMRRSRQSSEPGQH